MKQGIDHIGVSVVYFCHDGKGNFVAMKRGTNARDENGRWDIGGAGMEFGERAEQTLVREIKEEFCTDVIDYEFLGFRDVHRELNGKPTHWIALDFKVLIDPYKVAIGEPHKFDDLKWFTLEDFPENMHSQFPEFLRKYKNKLKTA
jgi:8-oxo-dGTP diphosphatase